MKIFGDNENVFANTVFDIYGHIDMLRIKTNKIDI